MGHHTRGIAGGLIAAALIVSIALSGAGYPAAASPLSSARPASASPAAAKPVNWPMYHGVPSHSGLSRSMPRVRGRLKVIKSLRLDGAVYASPIAVNGVIVVATENDSVYGFGVHGKRLWHAKVGKPSPAFERKCGNIDPLGITGTPIYSSRTGDVYVVAEHRGKVGHDLVALSLRTGKVRWRRNVDLPGPLPAAMQQRGALAITGGRVWVSFGAQFGDCSNYKGRVVGVRLNGKGRRIMFNPSRHRQGGIWNPAGPTVGSSGNMYVVSANGSTFPGAAYDHTNSVLKLSGSGKLLSSFAPTSWARYNEEDLGLGSQGVALIGNKWAVLGGKSGPVYVLRQSRLGGIGGQVSVKNICLSFGGAAVSGSVVYLPCTDGVRAVRVGSAGRLHVLWHAASSIAGSPVIGGGRVWALDQDRGVLHALGPAKGRTREQVRVGVTSRFATPAIYGNLVLVPTLTGVVFVRTS